MPTNSRNVLFPQIRGSFEHKTGVMSSSELRPILAKLTVHVEDYYGSKSAEFIRYVSLRKRKSKTGLISHLVALQTREELQLKKLNSESKNIESKFKGLIGIGKNDTLSTLKFNNICELGKGVTAFKIINLKVWRIQTGEDQRQIDKYVKYVPITASLKKLLLECGFLANKGLDKFIIPIPDGFKLTYVQDIISRSFTHYIKLATTRKIEYKDLRKTYITSITMALGDKAKLFTGHSDDAVIQKHYLADSVLMGGLTNLNIFDNCA